MAEYVDKKGRRLFVSDGIARGTHWMVCFRKPTGSLKRLVSKELPVCTSRSRAQQLLDAYAAKHGLMVAEPDA